MRKITIAMVCLFLGISLCFAQQGHFVSDQTINEISYLKHCMDTYAKDVFKESKEFGRERRDHLKKVLNYTSIISGNLKSLLSILGSGNIEVEEEDLGVLSSREVNKFVEYVILRIDTMAAELNNLSRTTNDAMMIHHVERANRLFKEAKDVLEMVKIELNQL